MRIEPSLDTVLRAFKAVQESDVFAESRSLVQDGHMPVEMIQAMSASDGMLQAFAAMCDAVYPGGTLDRDIQELVILTASIENACQFCHQSHIDIARLVGVADDTAQWLEDPTQLSEPQRLAREYTLQLMQDSNRVSDALFNAVQRAFGDGGTVELTMLVGYINMLNMFNNALQNRYHGELSQ